jgi:hypothetical protein
MSLRSYRRCNDKISIVEPDSRIDAGQKNSAWISRQRSRERQKLVGLLVLVLFILVLAFLRFGKTIPWGAR